MALFKIEKQSIEQYQVLKNIFFGSKPHLFSEGEINHLYSIKINEYLGKTKYLYSNGEFIKFTQITLMEILSIENKIDNIKFLFENFRPFLKKEIIIKSSFWAALNGHTDLFNYLGSKLTEEERKKVVRLNNYELINICSLNNYINLLDQLENLITPNEIKKAIINNQYKSIEIAIKNNNYDMFQHLLSYLTSSERQLFSDENSLHSSESLYFLFVLSAKQDIKFLKYLISHSSNNFIKNLIIYREYNIIDQLVESGNYLSAKLFLSYLNQDKKTNLLQLKKRRGFVNINQRLSVNHDNNIKMLEEFLKPTTSSSLNDKFTTHIIKEGYVETLKKL